MKVLGAKHIPQGGGAQKSGGVRGVCHVHHRGEGVEHLVVDHCVHSDGDTVLGQDLLGRDIKGDRPQVHLYYRVYTGDDGEQARTHGASLLNFAQPEDHCSFIFLEI